MRKGVALLLVLALIVSWLILAKEELENIGASETIPFAIDTELFPTAQVAAVSGTLAIVASVFFLFWLEPRFQFRLIDFSLLVLGWQRQKAQGWLVPFLWS